jgi:predicted dehydrogenase
MADSLMGVSKTRSPRAGLLIAVNQQLRYDEGMAAARAMVQAGWIGKVTAKTFTVNVTTDWAPWPWLVHSDRLEIMYHSIHYLDAIRAVLGSRRGYSAPAAGRPVRSPPGRPAPSVL